LQIRYTAAATVSDAFSLAAQSIHAESLKDSIGGCHSNIFQPYCRSIRLGRLGMSEHLDLDKMQAAYKAAVEEWIAAIKQEEALASVNHTVAEVDKWEDASFKEDELRNKVKAAKKRYEDALREKFFGF
jgi:hypothetical protein